MKKRTRSLLVVVALLAVGGFWVLLRDSHPSIPPFDSAIFGHIGSRDPRVVAIRKEDFGELREILEMPERDRIPMKWPVLGVLELRMGETPVSTVEIFTTPSGPGPLKILDDYYLGFDQSSFQSILDRSNAIELP